MGLVDIKFKFLSIYFYFDLVNVSIKDRSLHVRRNSPKKKGEFEQRVYVIGLKKKNDC